MKATFNFSDIGFQEKNAYFHLRKMDSKSEIGVRTRLVRHPKSNPNDFTRFCEVCGAKAINYNYGCITCESCKMFFRRNSDKTDLICVANWNCVINSNSRRHCSACRLKKCINIGMKKYVRDRQSSLASTPESSCVSSTTNSEYSPGNLSSSMSSPSNVAYVCVKEESDAYLNELFLNNLIIDKFPVVYTGDYVDQVFNRISSNLKERIDRMDPSISRLSVLPADDILYVGRLQEIINFTITKEVLDESLLPCMDTRTFDDLVNISDISVRGLIKFFNSVPCFSQLNLEEQKLILVLRIPCLLCLCAISIFEPPNIVRLNTPRGVTRFNWEHAVRSSMGTFEELPVILKEFEYVAHLKELFEDSFILIACVILMKTFEIHPIQVKLVNPELTNYCNQMFEKHTELLFGYLYHLKGPQKFYESWITFIQLYRWSRQALDDAFISITKKISSKNNLTPLAAEIIHLLHDKLSSHCEAP